MFSGEKIYLRGEMFQTLDDLLKSYKRKKNPFENKSPLEALELILFCVVHGSVIHLPNN